MAGQIRFYFDEHIPRPVAKGLQRRGVDVLTVQAAGRSGLSDEDQLAFARQESRVMVTMDSDFIALAAKGVQHAGIAYAQPQTCSIAELIQALLLMHDALEANDMVNHVEYL